MGLQLLSLQLTLFINLSSRHSHDLLQRKRKTDQETCLVETEHNVRYYSVPRAYCNFEEKKNKNGEINKIESNPKSFTIGTMSRKQMLT